MTREEAIDKIRKLLRMKRGGTAAEVETALALAAEIAQKHSIDLSSVNPDVEQEQPIEHIDTATSARLQWECKFAALVCQHFFNVTALVRELSRTSFQGLGRCGLRGKSNYCVTLIGTSWDTQIAIYVYKFLIYQFRNAWKTRRGRARNRHAFMHGMYHGISEKLEEQRRNAQTSQAGLVLIGKGLVRRNCYLQQHFGDTKEMSTTPDADAQAASLAGYLAGRDTEIRSGITNKGSAAPLLSI